ncbi:MerR family transcriptional regulator [Planctomyces sp. SCGC AG-212-M04]|nr:MerR family transcriptional regulator [Planctomyces sp. SCGC AG-212-M04]
MSSSLYSIGEFSRVTGLTVKTLRFYHEKGLLAPTAIDPETGYRFYDSRKIETARVITELRRLEFPVEQIAAILRECTEETDLLDELERQRSAIAARSRELREVQKSLDQIITHTREVRAMQSQSTGQIEFKQLTPQLVAGVRMKGRYSECGRGFQQIGRKFGRHICGPPLLLHYDTEYKETDADFEACMPVRKGTAADGIDVRELPGGRCVSLVHKGPYEELGPSYAKVFEYLKSHKLEPLSPTREVYLKGPGMIFRGNPRKYLTEIQVMVDEG